MGVRSPSVETVFSEAIEIDLEVERSAYLDRACGGDAALRRKVESLLDAHIQAGSFLQTSTEPETLTLGSPAADLGVTIGPYKLLEAIGEGGMGVVYMAEQTHPVRRKVALKLIKPGMDSKQIIARFEVERQALAMMDHPNIARVHDAGATAYGRPYFVMELVHGIPITDYCDREQLTIPERLELFVLVCRAVQHAHQKGIIHRDLKPSNILVTLIDGAAVPKVIDFGIAKATGQSLTDKTCFTAFSQFIGTPMYMSPEQADLSGVDVDTRSDVYALGVLLYELLTGTTPYESETFRKAAFDEIRRIIREQEPPKPSTRLSALAATKATVSTNRKTDPRRLDRSIRGELDWIVMKALDKDRSRRYETAKDFAADVMRSLNNQAVEACPPSNWYRFTKLARRNRGALFTGLLVALALALGTAISVWQAVRAVRAEQRAEVRTQQARRAIDRMYTQVAEKWMAQQPKLTSLQREFLEEALAFYQQFAEEKGDDLPTQLDALRARKRVATIEETLGRDDQAETTYQAMLRELEVLSKQHPDDADCSDELAWTLGRFGILCGRHGRFSEAESSEKRSIAIRESLADRFPDNREYRSQLADAVRNLGETYQSTGRNSEAVAAELRARDMFAKLHAEESGDVKITSFLAAAEDGLGRLWRHMGRRKDAEQAFRRALALKEQILTTEPNDPEHRSGLAVGLINLNTMDADKQAVLERDSRIIAILGKLAEAFPDRPKYREILNVSQMNYSITLKEHGRKDEAKQVVHEAVTTAEKLVADFPTFPDYRSRLARSLELLGHAQYDAGDADSAKTTRRRARELAEALVAEFPDQVDYRNVLGASLNYEVERLLIAPQDAALRDSARAVELARRACELAPGDQLCWKWLGLAEYLVGRWDAAIKASEKCIELRDDGGWYFMHIVLALSYAKQGDAIKAREWWAKAHPSTIDEGRLVDLPKWVLDEARALLGTDADKPKPAQKPSPPPG